MSVSATLAVQDILLGIALNGGQYAVGLPDVWNDTKPEDMAGKIRQSKDSLTAQNCYQWSFDEDCDFTEEWKHAFNLMGNAQKVLIVTINCNGKKHKEMLYRKEDGGVFLKELSDGAYQVSAEAPVLSEYLKAFFGKADELCSEITSLSSLEVKDILEGKPKERNKTPSEDDSAAALRKRLADGSTVSFSIVEPARNELIYTASILACDKRVDRMTVRYTNEDETVEFSTLSNEAQQKLADEIIAQME